MTQEQPKPLLFCYFGFEMQSQPQRTRGVCLQAGGVGTLAFLLPPVACVCTHTGRGPYALTKALLSAQVGQAMGARDTAVASKGVELLPPWEWTLTGASCELCNDGAGWEELSTGY